MKNIFKDKQTRIMVIVVAAVLVLDVFGGYMAYKYISGDNSEDMDLASVVEEDVYDYVMSCNLGDITIEEKTVLAKQAAANASSTVGTLTKKKNVSQDDISVIYKDSYFNTGVESKDATAFSQDQLRYISSGIEAVITTDIYSELSKRGYASADALMALEKNLQDNINTLSANVDKQNSQLNTTVDNIKEQVNNISDKSATDIKSINNDINKLTALVNDNGSTKEIEDQLAVLKEDLGNTTGEEFEKLKATISELEKKDNITTNDIESLNKTFNTAVDNQAKSIQVNRNNLEILKNDYEAKVLEYNQAIDNTNKTVETVKNTLSSDISKVDLKISTIEDSMNASLNEITDIVDQGKSDYDNYLDSLQSSGNKYLEDIASSKKAAEEKLAEDKASALNAIAEDRANATNAISDGKKDATDKIAEDRANALSDISTEKDNAISQVKNVYENDIKDVTEKIDSIDVTQDLEEKKVLIGEYKDGTLTMSYVKATD